MDLVVNAKLDKPIYEQIYDQISAQIVNGQIPPDFCLPSIRTIAAELGISVITVKKAYEVLENNGFIYTRAGKGCFVEAHQRPLDEIRLQIAQQKLQADLPFYRNLNITEDEMHQLISQNYSIDTKDKKKTK